MSDSDLEDEEDEDDTVATSDASLSVAQANAASNAMRVQPEVPFFVEVQVDCIAKQTCPHWQVMVVSDDRKPGINHDTEAKCECTDVVDRPGRVVFLEDIAYTTCVLYDSPLYKHRYLTSGNLLLAGKHSPSMPTLVR